MSKLYVVTGASGHVGNAVAEGLLDKGQNVRAICRHQDKMINLEQRGAELAVGDLQDRAFVEQAFAGGDAAFVLVPPGMEIQEGYREFQKRVAQIQADTVRKHGIKWVVTLSSVGGNLPTGNGPIAGLHDMEMIFDELDDVNIVHLRPGFFMENLLTNIGMIKDMGFLGTPAKPDLPLTMVATEDIGAAAVRWLIDCKFKGHIVNELQGNKPVTMKEVAQALGTAIGKPDLPYVQFGYEDAVNGMLQMGLPEERAKMYVEMYKGLNERLVHPTQERSPMTSTPTTIEHFARTVFAPAYRG